MDPNDIKPEHGYFAAFGAALAAIANKLIARRSLPSGPSRRERELEEQLLEQKFAAVRAEMAHANESLRRELADVLRENGRQGLRIEALEKDLDNYFRKLRGETPK